MSQVSQPDTIRSEKPENTPESVKYGERIIEEGELITFPNPRPGRRYDVQITLP